MVLWPWNCPFGIVVHRQHPADFGDIDTGVECRLRVGMRDGCNACCGLVVGHTNPHNTLDIVDRNMEVDSGMAWDMEQMDSNSPLGSSPRIEHVRECIPCYPFRNHIVHPCSPPSITTTITGSIGVNSGSGGVPPFGSHLGTCLVSHDVLESFGDLPLGHCTDFLLGEKWGEWRWCQETSHSGSRDHDDHDKGLDRHMSLLAPWDVAMDGLHCSS